tara:strand:- start:2206 stop:2451 length:246 start_codon:yes stop_codon:yes gene_type:complete
MNKVTENELQRIAFIKKEALDIASALGELQYQKEILDLQIQSQREKIKDVRSQEDKLFVELRDNYGNISINIETGEYTVVE